jgi:hypothetical protein
VNNDTSVYTSVMSIYDAGSCELTIYYLVSSPSHKHLRKFD